MGSVVLTIQEHPDHPLGFHQMSSIQEEGSLDCFPYHMPYQGGDHTSHFRGTDWPFPYPNQFGAIQQNSAPNTQMQGNDLTNLQRTSTDMNPLNLPANGNVPANGQNCGPPNYCNDHKQNFSVNSAQSGNTNVNTAHSSDSQNNDTSSQNHGNKTIDSDIVHTVSSLLSNPNILQTALYSHLKSDSKSVSSLLADNHHITTQPSTEGESSMPIVNVVDLKIADQQSNAIQELVKGTLKAVTPATPSTSITPPPPPPPPQSLSVRYLNILICELKC